MKCPEREIATAALTAYAVTFRAVGIAVPTVKVFKYADVWTVERQGEQAAHNAAFRITDAAARTVAVQACALFGEFVQWAANAELRDLVSVADALAEVAERAAWFATASVVSA
ncbi:hypothetical protein HII36_23180 [Nonomuraea sp. NN258]|uniref:hypothetical protein n=1 Tax=Nonomuraea antri TaxID=2730852 RepID=UPI001567E645|nr:hypothetical protein [Nonomuraea antri]NRQ34712.1 hypothetical protein [Nonomuraea antri]